MKGQLAKLRLICIVIGAIAIICGFSPDTFAVRRDCGTETDTGKRIKCETENLNDAFDGFVATAMSDDTGTFSERQKDHLQSLNNQAHNEADRTPSEDYKQLGKKRDVECFIQEILGDVTDANDLNDNGECDIGEECIGDEDGICDPNERNRGGCAEILDDGIGDDDGVCEFKGRYDEACIEICDPDLILAEGDERNVNRGKADDIEEALQDVTQVVDETSASVASFIESRRRVAAMQICDNNAMSACEYLECLMSNDRKYTGNEIEGVASGAAAAKILADGLRDTLKWDVVSNASAVTVGAGLVASGLNIAAVTLEVTDDSQTSERVDAIGACMQETSGQIQVIKANLQSIISLLQTPPGKRPGYQENR